MSQFLRFALGAGILYGLLMWLMLVLVVRHPVAVAGREAVLAGVIFGPLFAWMMISFSHSAWVKRSATPTFEPGERVVREGPANHFRRLEAVGGWLYLTNQRLVFKSHRLNIQRHQLSLPLDRIATARPSMTAWVIPNGLQVLTKDGRGERFVVEGRGEWVAALTAAQQSLPASVGC